MTPRYRGKHAELGVAAHAAMCADATLTPDQAINIARHDMLELDDQIMTYAAATGVDTVTIVEDKHGYEMDVCRYLGMDCGVGRDVVVIRNYDMFKSLDERILIRNITFKPPSVRSAREPKRRDWEQRNRKQRRR